MTKLRMFQCDAFTDQLFSGNPGAVVICDEWPMDATMQSIAAENNLAETAFLYQQNNAWHIRYFTPKAEIDLCGHATLCASHVIFHHLKYASETLTLQTRLAGDLTIRRKDDMYVMNLPAWPVEPITPDEHRELLACARVGIADIVETGRYRDYLIVVKDEAVVRDLKPDFTRMKGLKRFVCVTAPTEDGNFVSRFFTPTDGIDEDPVTGSAHCMLVPYWAAKMGKTEFTARQLSARGGVLYCRDNDGRVDVAGHAVTFFEAAINVPASAAFERDDVVGERAFG